MIILVFFLVLCLIFGVGAVIGGVAWLAFVGLLAAVVLAAIVVGSFRRSRS